MYRLSYVLTALVLSVAPAAAQTWQIDMAHSRAQFTVRHQTKSPRLAEISGAPDLTKKWQAIANEIRADILDHGLTEKGVLRPPYRWSIAETLGRASSRGVP